MTKLWVPYRRHAATFLLGSIPLLVASLVGLVIDNTVLAIAPLAAAFTPLLIAFILWLVCLRWDRCLRELQSEESLILHWTYDDEQWARHVELLGRKARRMGFWFAIGAVLVGFVVTLLMSFEEGAGESTLLVRLSPTIVGAAVGAVVWWLFRWNAESTRREQLRRGGELLLGANGFYLTGEYRPLHGLGQSLTDIRFEDDEEPRLVGTWHVSGGRYSSDHDVVIPVPPGREEETREVVRRLTDEPD